MIIARRGVRCAASGIEGWKDESGDTTVPLGREDRHCWDYGIKRRHMKETHKKYCTHSGITLWLYYVPFLKCLVDIKEHKYALEVLC